MKRIKCEGSGARVMLAWPPAEKDEYPGSVICPVCSQGVLVLRGSVRNAVSQAGHEGQSGIARVHWADPESGP